MQESWPTVTWLLVWQALVADNLHAFISVRVRAVAAALSVGRNVTVENWPCGFDISNIWSNRDDADSQPFVLPVEDGKIRDRTPHYLTISFFNPSVENLMPIRSVTGILSIGEMKIHFPDNFSLIATID
jgi:hypothetical protein